MCVQLGAIVQIPTGIIVVTGEPRLALLLLDKQSRRIAEGDPSF